MNLPLAFGSFLFFTGLVGFISWRRTRKIDNRDAQNYFLAGRKLPWFQVAGALLHRFADALQVTTGDLGTGVTTPGFRVHPAATAQASAIPG